MITHISYAGNRFAPALFCFLLALALFAGLPDCSCQAPVQDRSDKYFIGIELNGVLCGYSEVYVIPPRAAGAPDHNIDQKTYISFRALGQDMSQRQVFTYHIDPADGNFIYHDSRTEQGDLVVAAAMTVNGDSIYLQEGQAVTPIYLPANTLLPNTMFYPYLKADFGTGSLDSATHRIFNVRTGKVEDIAYYKAGAERIELDGSVYDAVIVKERDPNTGAYTTYWIDRDSGLRLKMEMQPGIRMYLTDLSVMERLSTGNWDDQIFVRTNERIGDLRRISSMTVQANLDAFPAAAMEDLNVPGQSFKGTITGNSLKGSFEVERHPYKGEDALPLGKTHRFGVDMQTYLQSEELIQSEAPEIRDLAVRLTEGSKDFWEATCRLGSWVAENINGSINGGSALEALRRGDGSCGPQSMLLAALCRASGIPARVVWGCVYTPEYGGSFGHHGWTEVYVGEAGWIPVDATLHETDYVDSGHVRLGVLRTNATVINFREMKILDFASR